MSTHLDIFCRVLFVIPPFHFGELCQAFQSLLQTCACFLPIIPPEKYKKMNIETICSIVELYNVYYTYCLDCFNVYRIGVIFCALAGHTILSKFNVFLSNSLRKFL